MRNHTLLLAVASAGASFMALAGTVPDRVSSEADACQTLETAAITYHLSAHDLTGSYFCEHTGNDGQYYYLGLRYHDKPSEKIGSNLIGWFAIRRSDGQVFRRDSPDSALEPIKPGAPWYGPKK